MSLKYSIRGAVLCGVLVTERIMLGVVYVDHGAYADIISLEDSINLIASQEGEKHSVNGCK
jgi:hypothetical protein